MAIEEVKGSEIQIVDYRNAKAAREAFESFKKSVLTADDFYKQGNKLYVRKSGWMMYAMALGITTHVYNERSESVKFKGQEALVYHFEAKAVAPNGRSSEAVGSASSDEGKPWCDAIHSIRAMAQTRAVERAISNLVGGGEVGADEMDTKSVDAEYAVRQTPQPHVNAVHDANDEDAAISLEQDIMDAITAAGLDPQGIEITKGRDWGQCIIHPIWPKPASEAENPWRKYNDTLFKMFGAKYHGKDDQNPDFKYNWTIGV